MRPTLVRAGQLAGVVRAAFGPSARLAALTRLPEGTSKGVYRVVMGDGRSAVVYIWDAAHNYWARSPATPEPDPADPFTPASGLDLFEAAQARLAALGVGTPQVYLVDRSGAHYPADLAVVEDVAGPSLEDLLERDPQQAEHALQRFAEAVRTMHACQGPRFGKVCHVDGGGQSLGQSCEQAALEQARHHLAETARRDPRLASASHQVREILERLAARVRPRADYRLIHGELDLGHVALGSRGQPVLLDIEGLMYFDVEWEHVFLSLRLDEHYRLLGRVDLDEDRLRLYRLAQQLSLIEGPLRILDGDYPDRQFFLDIAEYHTQQVLRWVHEGPPADTLRWDAVSRS